MKLWKQMHRNKHLGLAGVLSALLLAGCGDRPPEATGPERPAGQDRPKELPADVRQSQENLRQIGAAFLKYDLSCPAGFAGEDRKPILSWRVAILPQLGYKELFERFKINEPWDGPNNRKLLAEMPKVYRPARGSVKEGHTFYQGFTGPQAIFPALSIHHVQTATGVVYRPMFYDRFKVTDGLSYTLLVVEGGEPVPWTRPNNLPYDPAKPVPKLGGQFTGDFNALFCDGSVHLIPRIIPEKMLRALITPQGGEDVDLSAIGLPDPRRGTAEKPPPPKGTGTITGKVRYQGQPLPTGKVTLHLDDGMPNAPWKKFDDLKADGSFTLKDVYPAKYRVCVITMEVSGKPFVRIPEKYHHPGTTPLTVDVKVGEQTLNIELTN
jgi:prepilin-type processing-associated H-X9-DG protein